MVVFRSGGEPLTASSLVDVRSSSGNLLGVGTVENVLARGRTASIQPTMVLGVAG